MGISSMKTGSMKRSLLVGNTAYDPFTTGRALFASGYTSGANSNVIQLIFIRHVHNIVIF